MAEPRDSDEHGVSGGGTPSQPGDSDVHAHFLRGFETAPGEEREHEAAARAEPLAALFTLLPRAPEAWVEAAKGVPAARAQIDRVVVRAERDAAYRSLLASDLEGTLAADGIELAPALQRELHRRLAGR
jgi:hypothetical protein